METKIKDIYDCKYIKSIEELYPLQKWYNQLIDKTISQVTISDVLKMIRQKKFLDIAITKAVEFLKENPFSGDVYEGEILEKLSEMDWCKLATYSKDLNSILLCAIEASKKHTWLCKDEQKDFEKSIQNILNKILEM